MGNLAKILKYARPYRRLAAYALLALVAMVVLDLSVPRLVERIIDEGIKKKDLAVVVSTSAIMLAVSALSVVAAVLNNVCSVRVGEGVARDVREAIFVKVQGFSYGNLDRFPTGKVMVRLASDTSAVQRLAQIALRIGTRAPLSVMGSVALMFITSPRLAVMALPVLLLTAAVIALFSARMEPLFGAVQSRLDRLNTVLQENVAGARLVKSFVRADRENARFGEANALFAGDSARVMQYMSVMSPLLTFAINAATVLVVWAGAGEAARGAMTAGQIVAFVNYLIATMNPLVMMTQLANTWANGIASSGRIMEILDARAEIEDAPDAVDLPCDVPSAIELSNVSFHHNGHADRPVLDGVSLRVGPGETVAILGATGSGKSTLVSLIPRFYDPTQGTVLACGIDARKVRIASLRSRVAIVPQETVLFSGTVRDNIRYGRPDATDEEVAEAAMAAEAHSFIERLPAGYDTRVEERGVNLSGGQRQRIAIARAIAARPDVLILDDSTSAVDVETESRIQESIARLFRGKATVVVAQRISTVLNADRIAVLDGGKIVAEGTHAELLARSAIYREIYESQLGGGPNDGVR